MIVAISYGTYRADPVLWGILADLLRCRGHEVHCLTMLPESKPVGKLAGVNMVHCTGGQAMKAHMDARGLAVRTWIADRPAFIVGTPAPRNLAEPSSWADLPSTPLGL